MHLDILHDIVFLCINVSFKSMFSQLSFLSLKKKKKNAAKKTE